LVLLQICETFMSGMS